MRMVTGTCVDLLVGIELLGEEHRLLHQHWIVLAVELLLLLLLLSHMVQHALRGLVGRFVVVRLAL